VSPGRPPPRVLDQVVELAAGALGGDRKAAVLGEAARIDQVGDVLAGAAKAGGVAAVDRARAGLVGGRSAALERLGEVGADRVGIGVVGLGEADGGAVGGKLNPKQDLPLAHLVADPNGEIAHDAGRRRADLVVHLHRLDDEHRRVGPHARALGGDHFDDDPGERRFELHPRIIAPGCSLVRPRPRACEDRGDERVRRRRARTGPDPHRRRDRDPGDVRDRLRDGP
jgi:hypothetical protein